MRRLLPLTFILGFCTLAAVSSRAQNYTIDRSVISAGGGTISGGGYTLSGTIGQIDPGTLSGGIYQINGGFWSLNVAIQTPGTPTLSIFQSGGSVTISWPSSVNGYRLQTSQVVGPSANWQAVNGVANNTINQSISIGTHFYRLISP